MHPLFAARYVPVPRDHFLVNGESVLLCLTCYDHYSSGDWAQTCAACWQKIVKAEDGPSESLL